MPKKPPPCAVSAPSSRDSAPGVVKTSTRPTTVITALSAEEHRDQRDRHADRLAEAEQEDEAEDQQQDDGDQHGVAVQERRQVRVLRHVHGRVGRRQGDRDDPRGGRRSRAGPARTACPARTAAGAPASPPSPARAGSPAATRRYIGSMPSSVSATISSVASGDSAPAASAAMPAGRTAWRSSPRRSGTSPSTRTAAWSPSAGRLGTDRLHPVGQQPAGEPRCRARAGRTGLSTDAGTLISVLIPLFPLSSVPACARTAGARMHQGCDRTPAEGRAWHARSW